MSDTRESIRFSDRVPAGGFRSLSKRMQQAGTVERVDVRFYTGPDLSVDVEPYVLVGDEGDRERESLVELVGRQSVVGDGDSFSFHTSEGFRRDDLIGVDINNQSDNADPDGEGYPYDVIVDVLVDYAGGDSRSLVSLVSGVFN